MTATQETPASIRFGVRLGIEQAAFLRREAEKHGQSVSWVIRTALRSLFPAFPGEGERNQFKTNEPEGSR